MSKIHRLSLFEWSPRIHIWVSDLVLQLCYPSPWIKGKSRVWLGQVQTNKQTHKFVFLFYWNLPSLISTFSLHYSLEYEMTNLLGSDIRCYGPYWDLHHLQKDQEMRRHKTLTWKVESSGKSWIVLALASFSRGDETGGNGPSTTDNEETELFMKESIDLSASRWCFKPHAPQWGAGVCCVLCFTNRRTNSSPEYSQT